MGQVTLGSALFPTEGKQDPFWLSTRLGLVTLSSFCSPKGSSHFNDLSLAPLIPDGQPTGKTFFSAICCSLVTEGLPGSGGCVLGEVVPIGVHSSPSIQLPLSFLGEVLPTNQL